MRLLVALFAGVLIGLVKRNIAFPTPNDETALNINIGFGNGENSDESRKLLIPDIVTSFNENTDEQISETSKSDAQSGELIGIEITSESSDDSEKKVESSGETEEKSETSESDTQSQEVEDVDLNITIEWNDDSAAKVERSGETEDEMKSETSESDTQSQEVENVNLNITVEQNDESAAEVERRDEDTSMDSESLDEKAVNISCPEKHHGMGEISNVSLIFNVAPNPNICNKVAQENTQEKSVIVEETNEISIYRIQVTIMKNEETIYQENKEIATESNESDTKTFYVNFASNSDTNNKTEDQNTQEKSINLEETNETVDGIRIVTVENRENRKIVTQSTESDNNTLRITFVSNPDINDKSEEEKNTEENSVNLSTSDETTDKITIIFAEKEQNNYDGNTKIESHSTNLDTIEFHINLASNSNTNGNVPDENNQEKSVYPENTDEIIEKIDITIIRNQNVNEDYNNYENEDGNDNISSENSTPINDYDNLTYSEQHKMSVDTVTIQFHDDSIKNEEGENANEENNSEHHESHPEKIYMIIEHPEEEGQSHINKEQDCNDGSYNNEDNVGIEIAMGGKDDSHVNYHDTSEHILQSQDSVSTGSFTISIAFNGENSEYKTENAGFSIEHHESHPEQIDMLIELPEEESPSDINQEQECNDGSSKIEDNVDVQIAMDDKDDSHDHDSSEHILQSQDSNSESSFTISIAFNSENSEYKTENAGFSIEVPHSEKIYDDNNRDETNFSNNYENTDQDSLTQRSDGTTFQIQLVGNRDDEDNNHRAEQGDSYLTVEIDEAVQNDLESDDELGETSETNYNDDSSNNNENTAESSNGEKIENGSSDLSETENTSESSDNTHTTNMEVNIDFNDEIADENVQESSTNSESYTTEINEATESSTNSESYTTEINEATESSPKENTSEDDLNNDTNNSREDRSSDSDSRSDENEDEDDDSDRGHSRDNGSHRGWRHRGRWGNSGDSNGHRMGSHSRRNNESNESSSEEHGGSRRWRNGDRSEERNSREQRNRRRG